tara:strand:+ start:3966 stop:4385 length:420 start_codon:yes stop_codon:yes gene_type:complete
MNKIKRMMWFSLGLVLLGISYVGVIVPGIPWSTPAVGAAYCFAKSNDRWHKWLMNHKFFGPFLQNWVQKRVFPAKGKWAMLITMDISLITLWFTTGNFWLCAGVSMLMVVGAVWAWRYPSSVAAYEERLARGLKIGWLR